MLKHATTTATERTVDDVDGRSILDPYRPKWPFVPGGKQSVLSELDRRMSPQGENGN